MTSVGKVAKHVPTILSNESSKLIVFPVLPPIIPEKKTYATPTNDIAINTRRIVAIIPDMPFIQLI